MDFEKGLVKIIRDYQSEMNYVIEMMNDINLYKNHGYTVKYYLNTKEGSFNYQANKKGEIGFKPEVEK